MRGSPPEKKNDGGAKIGEVVDERPGFGRGQFALIGLVARAGIAVDAAQVAALSDVPDHNRFLVP